MALYGLHHAVILVPDVPAAERYYRDLLGLPIRFREGIRDDEVGEVPADIDWERALAAGIEPRTTFLGRDGFTLAVAARENESSPDSTRFYRIAIAADEAELDAAAERAREVEAAVRRRDDRLIIEDRFGVEWVLNSTEPPPETGFETFDI